ncbi:DUF1674 domain-containing protein [Methylomarinum vadi]|uniref:DUF1674 domain-containing protein n=1 Tax=Methylomarinum vadi TaxID=438855 RepID=UPI000566EC92|nr:succinate dehydrogenase assembly factor 4 [Methylomarinum vadi]
MNDNNDNAVQADDTDAIVDQDDKAGKNIVSPAKIPEIGGAPGLEPTRYGDWEKNGRCIDF